MIGTPGRISKHRQFDPDTGKHIPGDLRITANSSLRKLMRAARRGKLPEDRQFTIAEAAKQAAKHPNDYLSSFRRGMNAFVAALDRARA